LKVRTSNTCFSALLVPYGSTNTLPLRAKFHQLTISMVHVMVVEI